MILTKCTCNKPIISALHTGNRLAKDPDFVNFICLRCNAHAYGNKDNPTQYSGKEWEAWVNSEETAYAA